MKKKLFILSIFLLIGLYKINVYASDLAYHEGDTSKNSLYVNVEHIHSKSTVTNDNGTTTDQNVNVVINKNQNVKVVTWTKFDSSGSWSFGTVEEIARDFEAKNPGYQVISAVNGDYFAYSPNRTINANVVFGGDIVKPINHSKYFGVGFDESGRNPVIGKNVYYGKYYLSIYDESSNKIEKIIELQEINAMTLDDNQTTVYFDTETMNLPDTKKYIINNPQAISFMDSHLFAKGIVNEITYSNNSISNKEFAIVTNDNTVIELLDKKPLVRVQKMVTGDFINSDMIIGVDSQILKDGDVRTFNEIGGQSENNTMYRQPRTSFGFSSDGSFIMATVDGRQGSGETGVYSSGVDLRELAEIMRSYGCTEAFNLDGGGSTQMIVRDELGDFTTINSPSEGPNFPINHAYYKESYRKVANVLLFVVPDINVTTTYSDFTKDSVSLSYNIQEKENVLIKNSILYVNGNEIGLSEKTNNFTIENLIEDGINIFNFQFVYEKDGIEITKVFSKKVIDLSVNSGIREKELPKDFNVLFEEDELNQGFKVKVYYEDNDRTMTKMKIIRQDNNQMITALVAHAGCRVAVIENAEIGKTYDFKIEYYYDLNTKSKILDDIYTYTYNPETNEDQDEQEQIILDDNNQSYLLYYISSSTLLIILGSFIIIKRKSK